MVDASLPAWARAQAPPVLTAPGVRLRPLHELDRDAVHRAVRDPQTIAWTTVPDPYPPDGFDQWLQQARDGWADASNVTWAITDADTGEYLGGIDLRLDGEAGAEVGYSVAPWGRGRGVATTALALACEWGFATADLAMVLWLAFAGNEASRRTALRVGFRVLDQPVRAGLAQRGRRRDAWVADLLPGDLRRPW